MFLPPPLSEDAAGSGDAGVRALGTPGPTDHHLHVPVHPVEPRPVHDRPGRSEAGGQAEGSLRLPGGHREGERHAPSPQQLGQVPDPEVLALPA